MMFSANTETKMASTDRVIVLEPIDNKDPKNAKGNIDPKIFSGENKLHAIMDEESTHWFLKYDNGGLPEPLKQRFTSFKTLLQHVEGYFRTRNLKVKEVVR